MMDSTRSSFLLKPGAYITYNATGPLRVQIGIAYSVLAFYI